MEFKGLKREYELIGAEITDHIQKVIASGNFISGDDVVQLESKLADYVGVRHCISCANATDGLILALMAIGKQCFDLGGNTSICRYTKGYLQYVTCFP